MRESERERERERERGREREMYSFIHTRTHTHTHPVLSCLNTTHMGHVSFQRKKQGETPLCPFGCRYVLGEEFGGLHLWTARPPEPSLTCVTFNSSPLFTYGFAPLGPTLVPLQIAAPSERHTHIHTHTHTHTHTYIGTHTHIHYS